MADALRYIGIARKAGAIEIGETNSGVAVRAGKAKLLILASDASDNAKARAEGFIYGRKTPLVKVPFTKRELSDISGVNGCSMAAFTDTGLASVFLSQLAQSEPRYSAAAGYVAAKNEKEKIRKREAASHEKNKRLGKSASMRRKNH